MCYASLGFLPHPSLFLFGNSRHHLESWVSALEVHLASGHGACFSCAYWCEKSLRLKQPNPSCSAFIMCITQGQIWKITALLWCCLLDFKESSPAWDHGELKWVGRQKVEEDYHYLLISRDEIWFERSKWSDNGMVQCSGGLLFINR